MPRPHATGLHTRRVQPLCAPVRVFDKLKSFFNSDSTGGGREAEEEEGEDDDGGSMVKIDSNAQGVGIAGEGAFGPLACLLVGFLPDDITAFRALMAEMEADMVKVVPCTRAMLNGTLGQALEVEPLPAYEQPALGTRRAVVLSGMYQPELIDVVTSYRESGMPPAVFAAAVPNNYGRVLAGLLREVQADAAAMKQRAEQAAAEASEEQS
ncbi:hypothetical protein FOA52_011756 [Chlamydomonas sp. UWO 241]|nr:hypothetical protein FOA52_011756 [Chlamydomonas sp. UWO 241]